LFSNEIQVPGYMLKANKPRVRLAYMDLDLNKLFHRFFK
jgi:hypothetical protein